MPRCVIRAPRVSLSLTHAHTRLTRLTAHDASPLSLLAVRSRTAKIQNDLRILTRAARAHQRQPRAQDHLAQRVRQNHPGDGGRARSKVRARRCRCRVPPLPCQWPPLPPAAAGPPRAEASVLTFIACVSRRLWRARKRCCTCSSARASTSRRRSRPRRERRSREREWRERRARGRGWWCGAEDLGGARVPRSFSFGARVWTVCVCVARRL